MTDDVEVWLDADFLERMRVGTLSHDRGTLRFAYDPVWLKNPQAFALDPDLRLLGDEIGIVTLHEDRAEFSLAVGGEMMETVIDDDRECPLFGLCPQR